MAGIHVAYLTHYAERYGANRSLLELILELRERGLVRPLVVMPREGSFAEVLRRHDIDLLFLPFEPWLSERYYGGRFYHRWGQHRAHQRAARERERHNRRIAEEAAAQLRAAGIDLLHANSAAVGIAHLLRKRIRLPLVWHVREMPERHYKLHFDAGRKGYGRALAQADHLIAISPAVERDIRRYTGPKPPITVVPNGVLHRARYPEVRAQGAARWNSTTPFVFAQIGLIHPGKGLEEAVEALAEVRRTRPDVRLLIAGDGKQGLLERVIERTGQGGAVSLLGFVEDPFTVLRQAHALLMCSRHEAMGRVTVEAMASGLPVIGHASGGTTDLITDGMNGLLYPGGVHELAQRMLQLIDAPELARRLGDTASRIAEERFNIERYADEVLKVYRSVLSAPASP